MLRLGIVSLWDSGLPHGKEPAPGVFSIGACLFEIRAYLTQRPPCLDLPRVGPVWSRSPPCLDPTAFMIKASA